MIPGCPNGETRLGAIPVTALGRSEPGELKHLSTRRKRNQVEMPSVAASERGGAQTVSLVEAGL